ncbi:MAG: lipopolysaccharide biosynthesis protein [Gemmatimonadota bacterium]
MRAALDVDSRSSLPSGARSGALIAAASMVAIGLNYIFLVVAARLLGSRDYGALAALLGLLTVVLLPAGAVQLAVSREVSRRLAVGDAKGADAFGWAALRLGLIATVPIVALSLALVIPLREILNIESTGVVALTTAALVAVFALPVAMGVLQGYQRFIAIAAMFVVPFAIRLGLLALAALAGLRLGGAVFAAVAATIAAAALAIAIAHGPLRRGASAVRPSLGPFLRYLWPVVVGVLGIAVLTNFDLLVVKARFSPDDAGEYAAASAFARVAFFLPATILAVLFPRTAARQARGEDTADILGRSLLATAAFGALLMLFYAMTGRGLVHTSFGAEFAEGGELLVPFTASMTLFALANVLVGFHLSRDETYYAWIVAVIVPVQLVLLTFFPIDLRGVIWANIGVGIGLLAAHELFVESSAPALRAGWGHLWRGIELRRKVVFETLLTLVSGTLFVSILMWPLTSRLGSAFIGGERSDASATIAALWRYKDDGYHIFGTTARAIPGLPIGWEEPNGTNLQVLFAYYPAHLASKIVGEIAAYNLVVLSGFVLSGAAMYLLTRYLGCSRLVATWAGMAYIVFPWHLERAVHASLVHIEVLVLLVIALVAAAERPSWMRFALVGLATLSGWLTTGYLGAMAAIGAVAFALAAAAAMKGRRGRMRLIAGTTASAGAASAFVAFLSMVSGFSRGEELGRTAGTLSTYGLRLTELVVPAAGNLVVGKSSSRSTDIVHESNPTETSNYLGLLTITLAAAWLVVAWRRRASLSSRLRAATPGFVGLIVVGLAFALPSPLSVFGYEWSWTPSRILWEALPAFRIPTRWTPVVMTALIPLAALALQGATVAVSRRATGRLRSRLAPAALVSAVMLVSVLELAVNPTEELFKAQDVPPRYEAVARTPFGTLAEYPLVRLSSYSFWQRVHGRPLLNEIPPGSTADDVRADDIRRVLLDPGAPGTASQLALLGVSAIVTDARALDFTDEALYFGGHVPDFPDATWGDGYELVARFPDHSSVWRVVASPAPALVTLPGGFGEPTPPIRSQAGPDASGFSVSRGGLRVGYPFVQGAGVGYLEFRAREDGTVRLSFDAEPPNRKRRVLRIADAENERPFVLDGRTGVSLLVHLPRGVSRLLIKTDPAPTSESDAIVFSAPWVERVVGAPYAHAELVSPDPGF